MRIENSGRVRFTRDGIRFVVTKNNVRAYQRETDKLGSTEYAINRDRTARAVYNNITEVGQASALLALSNL